MSLTSEEAVKLWNKSPFGLFFFLIKKGTEKLLALDFVHILFGVISLLCVCIVWLLFHCREVEALRLHDLSVTAWEWWTVKLRGRESPHWTDARCRQGQVLEFTQKIQYVLSPTMWDKLIMIIHSQWKQKIKRVGLKEPKVIVIVLHFYSTLCKNRNKGFLYNTAILDAYALHLVLHSWDTLKTLWTHVADEKVLLDSAD